MDIRISWSQLRTHEECKAKAFLKREGYGGDEDQRNFFPGNITDQITRRWLLNAPLLHLGEMPAMVPGMIEELEAKILASGGRLRWRDAGDRRRVEADCIEAVQKIEPALLKYVTSYRFEAGKRFRVPYTVPDLDGNPFEILLVGEMDILVQDSHDRWWVWDVKHTRDRYYWKKTAAQLTFYDLATETMFGKPTVRVGLFQPLCERPNAAETAEAGEPLPGTVLPFNLTADDRAQLRQRVIAFAQDRMRDDHAPKGDSKGCSYCPVHDACPKFDYATGVRGRSMLARP